jgi:hypothetical protein
MKLTWFGDETFRIHAAGAIVVVEGAVLPEGVDRVELVAGGDVIVNLPRGSVARQAGWRPRAPLKILDEDEKVRLPETVALEEGVLALDADGEAPLVLTRGGLSATGRWVGQAVVVLIGERLAERGVEMLETVQPRLIALAGADQEVAFEALRDRLDGTGLVALERGLAVEV